MLNILYLGSHAVPDQEVSAMLSGTEFSIHKSICRTDRMEILGAIAKERPDIILIRSFSANRCSGHIAELLHDIREADASPRIVLLTDKHSRITHFLALEYDVSWVVATESELDLLPKVLARLDRNIQKSRLARKQQVQRMFLDFIRDEQRLDDTERSLLFRDVQPDDLFQVSIVHILAPYRKRSVLDQKNLVNLKGYDILMNQIGNLSGCMVVRDNLHWIVCLRGTAEHLTAGRERLSRFLREMREFDQTISSCGAWVFLGTVESDVHGISRSYRSAKSMLNERLLRPGIDLIEQKSLPAHAPRKKESYQVFDVRKAMLNSMETFDELMTHKTLEQLKSNILSATDFTGSDLFSIYKTLIATLYQELERREISLREVGRITRPSSGSLTSSGTFRMSSSPWRAATFRA